LWEALNPVPLEGEGGDEGGSEKHKRITLAEDMVEQLIANLPQNHAGHPIFAEVPEEETYSSQMQLQWSSWFGYADVPSYMRWVNQSSMEDSYRWLRKVMQYMIWQNGGAGKRWLIKAPFHLGFLDDLFTVFPDLRIIHCHRQPLSHPVASLTKLVTIGRVAFNAQWDIKALGQEILSYFASWIERTSAQRDRHLGRIFDVAYSDTFERGPQLLGAIHGWLGLPYGDAEAALVAAWEADNPQHVHGKFEYTVEECGLDDEMVNEAFGSYADWVERFMDRPGLISRPAADEPTW
jgi:Sulfotransferase family